MSLHFARLTEAYLSLIFAWLDLPHVIEFWDTSQAHKDDLINFTEGRKMPSSYCDGKMVYWLAFENNVPYAMIMTEHLTANTPVNQEKLSRLSKTGQTYGLDFMIGNPTFLNQGYGAKTLSEFLTYFRQHVDQNAETFLIDPDTHNPKAAHVYSKAGFIHACDFMMTEGVSGSGNMHHLFVRHFAATTQPADLNGITLFSQRLICKTLCTDYAEDICRHFTADITHHMWPSAPKTLQQIIEYIFGQQHAMQHRQELALAVFTKLANEFLGCISIHRLSSTTPELGIWLKTSVHGQGYGFEALSCLKNWAEAHLTYQYLKYPVVKINHASRALAEKLGGTVADEYVKYSEDGRVLDEVEYHLYKG